MLLQSCQVLSRSEVEDILDMACQILADAGCVFENATARDSLAAMGADVNKKENRVRIAADTIADVLSGLRQTYHTSLTDPSLVMGYANQIHDPQTRQNRKATWEDCKRILAIGQECSQIGMVSWGAETWEETSASQIAPADALRYTTKPVYLGLAKCEIAQTMLDAAQRYIGGEEKLKKQIRIAGAVRPAAPFLYHSDQTDLVKLYSQYNQPIYWYSQYHSNLAYPLASVLALQTAEILAGICYAISIKSHSPFLLCPATPQDIFTDFDTGAIWNCLLYQVATIQIGHHLGLPVAVSGLMPSSPDFAHSIAIALWRQLIWFVGADQFLGVGVTGCGERKTFSPVIIAFENAWREYWGQVCTPHAKASTYPIAQFIQEVQQGKFSRPLSLWNTEFFCKDELELWRKRRMPWLQSVTTQFTQRWQNLEPVVVAR